LDTTRNSSHPWPTAPPSSHMVGRLETPNLTWTGTAMTLGEHGSLPGIGLLLDIRDAANLGFHDTSTGNRWSQLGRTWPCSSSQLCLHSREASHIRVSILSGWSIYSTHCSLSRFNTPRGRRDQVMGVSREPLNTRLRAHGHVTLELWPYNTTAHRMVKLRTGKARNFAVPMICFVPLFRLRC
jgi:hypothetical protein